MLVERDDKLLGTPPLTLHTHVRALSLLKLELTNPHELVAGGGMERGIDGENRDSQDDDE